MVQDMTGTGSIEGAIGLKALGLQGVIRVE